MHRTTTQVEVISNPRFELAFIGNDLDATAADLKKSGIKFIREIHDAGGAA